VDNDCLPGPAGGICSRIAIRRIGRRARGNQVTTTYHREYRRLPDGDAHRGRRLADWAAEETRIQCRVDNIEYSERLPAVHLRAALLENRRQIVAERKTSRDVLAQCGCHSHSAQYSLIDS
jgi:hypothetical protein